VGTDEVSAAFGGWVGLPTTFIVGKDKNIYRKYFGATANKVTYMEKDIEELLGAAD
jgi:hypothetical protein